MVVVARDATQPQIDVDSVSLLEMKEASCSPVGITAAFAIFQFPVIECGTTMQVGGKPLFKRLYEKIEFRIAAETVRMLQRNVTVDLEVNSKIRSHDLITDFMPSPPDNSFTCIVGLTFKTNAASLQEEEGYVVYENHMSSSYEVGIGPRGSITRDSHFE